MKSISLLTGSALIWCLLPAGPGALAPLCWNADAAPGVRQHRPHYAITALDPPPDFDFAKPTRLNKRGEILGYAGASSGPFAGLSHAVFYEKGELLDLHALVPNGEGTPYSDGVDLSDNGHVLFLAYAAGVFPRYFLYRDGRLQDFSELVGRTDLAPRGINSAMHIVGVTLTEEDSTGQAFVYAKNKLEFLGRLEGFPYSAATRISNSGGIIGTANNSALNLSEFHAVSFTREGIIDLGGPISFGVDVNEHGHVLITRDLIRNGQRTPLAFVGLGLNNIDQVVGLEGLPVGSEGFPSRAMLYSNGMTYDLNGLIDPGSGWRLLEANDINDKGEIVGLGLFNGQYTGFLLTPSRSESSASARRDVSEVTDAND